MTTAKQGRLSLNVFRAALCLLLAAAASPARQQEKVIDSSQGGETRTTIRRSEGDYSLEATAVGDVEFTDDDADVKSVAAGGRLVIKEQRGGSVRKLKVVRGDDGRPRHSYFVQGEARAFDQEGRAWLARLLPELIRGSGVNAAARVRRILGRRGADGVLEEIALIESDGVRRIYFDELLKSGGLDDAALRRAVRQAAREISSDGEKALLLIEHAGLYVNRGAGRADFFDAVDTISSDGERARVLTSVLGRSDLPRDTLLRLFKSAARISSDGEKANVLVAAARLGGDDQTVLSALHEAARTIASDGERQRVLSALAQRGSPPAGRS